jgi:hypothetical protein
MRIEFQDSLVEPTPMPVTILLTETLGTGEKSLYVTQQLTVK